MDFLSETISIADKIFRWDGWRALAAIGTFLAVWIALRRDERADRRIAIKESHLIGAILDHATTARIMANEYESSISKPKVLDKHRESYFRLGGLDSNIQTLKSISVSDCPTVEVMTTKSVLAKIFENIDKAYQDIESQSDTEPKKQLRSLSHEISCLNICIEDLKVEMKAISGRHYEWAHQDGHRRKVAEKVNGTLRTRALRALPGVLGAIITNRAPAEKASSQSKAR